MSALEILALLPLLSWTLLLFARSRSWPDELHLPEEPPGARPAPAAEAIAVVPARDEAALLPRTLPALLDQEPLRLVVLVDDGSDDGTATLARDLAERTGHAARLRVIEAGPPPPGWTGKLHALARGLEAVPEDGEWVLFTDADVRLRPGAVAALLAMAEGRGGHGPRDLVSVMARLRAESFWERLLVPAFVFFFQLLYPFRHVAREESPTAAAAGGCVLVRRRLLEAAGGLGSIRGAVIDDVALARRVAGAGGRLWLGLDPGIVSLRAYPTLGHLWRMVARSAFSQLGYRWSLLAATLPALALLVASPPLLAVAAAVAASGGPLSWPALRPLVWALGAWVLQTRALLPAVRHHRVAPGWAAALPAAGLLFGLMTAASAWGHLTGRGARWKGRQPPASAGACRRPR